MSNAHDAHRRSMEHARHAKQLERYEAGKKRGSANINEASSTHVHHNPSKFQLWLDKLLGRDGKKR